MLIGVGSYARLASASRSFSAALTLAVIRVSKSSPGERLR